MYIYIYKYVDIHIYIYTYIYKHVCVCPSAGKNGDSPIKLDTKMGPQTHFGAKSQYEGTIQLVPKS